MQLFYDLSFYSLELPTSAGHFVVDIGDTIETSGGNWSLNSGGYFDGVALVE